MARPARMNNDLLAMALVGYEAQIEKITEAIGGGETEEMHPPKYKALEDSAAKCVVTGNDCLRHCYGMFSMKDTSMAACANAAFQLVAACADGNRQSSRTSYSLADAVGGVGQGLVVIHALGAREVEIPLIDAGALDDR